MQTHPDPPRVLPRPVVRPSAPSRPRRQSRRWVAACVVLLALAAAGVMAVVGAGSGWLPRALGASAGAGSAGDRKEVPATGPATKPAKKPKVDVAEEFFDKAPIPKLRIELSPAEMDALRKDPRAYVRATVTELSGPPPKAGDKGDKPKPAALSPTTSPAGPASPAGTTQPATRPTHNERGERVYYDVAIHLKGFLGSFRQVDDKPGLTLHFDKFVPGQKFHGLDKFHLNNCVQDPSYLSEAMGNSIFRDAGVPGTRTTHAHVWLNDRDLGMFLLKEGFDSAFFKHFFHDHSGTLVESVYTKDVDSGELLVHGDKTPEGKAKAEATKARLKELAAAAHEQDPAVRRKKLAAVLDVDRFMTFMALEAMTSHWDGYCSVKNNYRIYLDPRDDRFVFLPHGTDQLFQQSGYGLFTANALVAQAMIAAPEDRSRYYDRVAELRAKVFDPDVLTKRLDAMSARLLPAMREISDDAARQHQAQAADLRRRVIERVKGIDAELAANPRPLRFDSGGVASLADARWEPKSDAGQVTADRPADSGQAEGGQARLHLKAGPGGGTASFRTSVLLAQGKYVFEGQVRTAGVVAPDGQNTGAGLRISGGQRDGRLVGTIAAAQRVEFPFEVTEPSRQVVLVCDLKATAGEAWFDPATLRLRKR